MNSEYDHFRELLLNAERDRLDRLDAHARDAAVKLQNIPDILAVDIEKSLSGDGESRLAVALSEATAGSLEVAVRRRPQAVVDAMYPVIGPAIRRALSDALRNMTDDLDSALRDTLSLRSWNWRLEAWRTGIPYAQVVLRHTAQCRIEHLLLIRPQSGLLLCHLAADGVTELDADAVAGMFTAINQFVRDSLSIGDPDGGIASATVGGYELAVSDGPSARLVAFVQGVPYSGLDRSLDEINEEIHATHGSYLLESAATEPDTLNLLTPAHLRELNDPQNTAGGVKARTDHKFIGAALLLALLFMVVQSVMSYRWSAKVEDIKHALADFPGLFVSDVDGSQRGIITIAGMIDPLASDPGFWINERYPGIEIEWKLNRFVSLDPGLIRRRMAHRLDVPVEVVGLPNDRGVIQLEGEVSFATWYRVQQSILQEAGVSGIDFSKLRYRRKQEVDALVHTIESSSVEFIIGTSTPTPSAREHLVDIRLAIDHLQDWSQDAQAMVILKAIGSTDEVGSESQNRILRIQRAEWLAETLAPSLSPPMVVEIDRSVVTTLPYRGSVREGSLDVSLVPVGE